MPGVPVRIRWLWGGGGLHEHWSEMQNDRQKVIFKEWVPELISLRKQEERLLVRDGDDE